jgi:hypothetical protein
MGMRGYPKKEAIDARAKDAAVAERLWQVSEKMSGVAYAWRAENKGTIWQFPFHAQCVRCRAIHFDRRLPRSSSPAF